MHQGHVDFAQRDGFNFHRESFTWIHRGVE
jgi:hypothetical protein